jgi:hypothetical protein
MVLCSASLSTGGFVVGGSANIVDVEQATTSSQVVLVTRVCMPDLSMGWDKRTLLLEI